MGFVIWHQVTFLDDEAAQPTLRVSNDLRAGDVALDADITVESWSGANAGRFVVRMRDLPLDRARELSARHARAGHGAGPLLVDVRLGYFDQPDTQTVTVLRGAVTEVHAWVTGIGELVTEVRGQELAGYRLLQTGRFAFHQAGPVGLAQAAHAIGAAAGVTVLDGGLAGQVDDLTQVTDTALAALAELADRAAVPVVVRDGRVYLGAAVPTGEPAEFVPRLNIVSQNRRDENPRDLLAPDPVARTRYDLVVLGDPELRVGRRAVITPPGATRPNAGLYELEYVQHRFSKQTGYVCEVIAVAVEPGPPAVRRRGPGGVVDGVRGLVRSTLANTPAIDVGAVASYRAGATTPAHRATLRYGQPPPAGDDKASPVVSEPVAEDAPRLHDKPLAAPFAWHHSGLVVPVYPGMRALLAHNRGDVNDPVVAGFVWSTADGHEPPSNEDGDYWLCLPTEVRDGLPAGKGVNDLTDATGHRSIQARGLSIAVADGQLPEVGTRPPVPDTLAFEIAHENGTAIRVGPDGALTIQTDGQDITIGNGSASITISGGTLTLHGASVEVR